MNHDGPTMAALQFGMLGLAVAIVSLAAIMIIVFGVVSLIQAIGRLWRGRHKMVGSIFDKSTRSR